VVGRTGLGRAVGRSITVGGHYSVEPPRRPKGCQRSLERVQRVEDGPSVALRDPPHGGVDRGVEDPPDRPDPAAAQVGEGNGPSLSLLRKDVDEAGALELLEQRMYGLP
jgi:hypothetical protein